jgi:hypothetical protein
MVLLSIKISVVSLHTIAEMNSFVNKERPGGWMPDNSSKTPGEKRAEGRGQRTLSVVFEYDFRHPSPDFGCDNFFLALFRLMD